MSDLWPSVALILALAYVGWKGGEWWTLRRQMVEDLNARDQWHNERGAK